jgi:hypothetical protein
LQKIETNELNVVKQLDDVYNAYLLTNEEYKRYKKQIDNAEADRAFKWKKNAWG